VLLSVAMLWRGTGLEPAWWIAAETAEGGLALLSTPFDRLGLAIYKDMDFPRLDRRYAQRDVSMLLVPAWDFAEHGWLHSRMAALRGVEGALPSPALVGSRRARGDR
jgi:hypothetical protein